MVDLPNGSVKVGVIGFGKMGALHCGILNSLPNVNLMAICDTDKIVNSVLRSNMDGISVYTDYIDMLNKENLNAVYITTPVFLHHPMLSEIIKRRDVSVFIEKPLAMNFEQCKNILKNNSNRSNMVGYCRRFLPTYNNMKKILEEGSLGKVLFFESNLFVDQVHKPIDSWLYDKEKSGGGVLMDLGCHAIDLIQYIFGDVRSVYATNVNHYKPDIEDASLVNFRLKDNTMGYLCISWSKFEYRVAEFSIKANCENGWISATEKNVEYYSNVDGDAIKKGYHFIPKQDLQKPVPVDIGGPEYTTEDMEFIKAVITKGPSPCPFDQASRVNEIIDSIYLSAETDKSIHLIR